MNPHHWQASATLETAKRRARLLAMIREYFASEDVLEVQTPCLSRAAVSDRHIESIGAVYGRQAGFLRTSPEYAMKRLLASGYPDIFEVGPVFRDGEQGRNHQPEFQMIEWYRRDFSLEDMIDDTLALISTLLDTPDSALHQRLSPPAKIRYDEAMKAACGVTSNTKLSDLSALLDNDMAQSLGNDRDAVLDIVFDQCVAQHFAADRLTVVTHYPSSQAALANICPETSRALRFEIYFGSRELANGFVELQDAREQAARFERDQSIRLQDGLPIRPLDQAFLSALVSGLPACAGVAVGLERLLMLHSGQENIQNVVSFIAD
ncbi:MAG: EF-P lysine aminoacylase EpmA [Pseudomonadota bacterium]